MVPLVPVIISKEEIRPSVYCRFSLTNPPTPRLSLLPWVFRWIMEASACICGQIFKFCGAGRGKNSCWSWNMTSPQTKLGWADINISRNSSACLWVIFWGVISVFNLPRLPALQLANEQWTRLLLLTCKGGLVCCNVIFSGALPSVAGSEMDYTLLFASWQYYINTSGCDKMTESKSLVSPCRVLPKLASYVWVKGPTPRVWLQFYLVPLGFLFVFCLPVRSQTDSVFMYLKSDNITWKQPWPTTQMVSSGVFAYLRHANIVQAKCCFHILKQFLSLRNTAFVLTWCHSDLCSSFPRGSRHAGRLPPGRHLLPLQPLHEWRRLHGRESAGKAGSAAGGRRSLLGAERAQAEQGGAHPHSREGRRPQDVRVGQAQGQHVQRSLV